MSSSSTIDVHDGAAVQRANASGRVPLVFVHGLWLQGKVKSKNTDRGPLLIICGERDHTVPPSIAKAAFKRQQRNVGVTEYAEIPGRGHSLTIDEGWREVAETTQAFVRRFA